MNTTLPRRRVVDIPAAEHDGAPASARRPLPLVLWQRRGTLLLTTVGAVGLAIIYLLRATPIFTSQASIVIERQGVHILSEGQGYAAKSDSYLYTQAEIIRSAPILSAALEKVDQRRLKTFAGISNPVAWLQNSDAFRVDVGKKDDVLTVSVDSPYPQEAADLVNGVVDAYVTHQTRQKRKTAAEVMLILQKEKRERDAELQQHLHALLRFKKENSALSFRGDKGNIIIERLATLSDALTKAQLEALDAQTQKALVEATLRDPEQTQKLIDSLQHKVGAGPDRELDSLRETLQQRTLALSGYSSVHGPKSLQVRVLEGEVDAVRQMVVEKERRLGEAHLQELTQQSLAADQRAKEIQAAFQAQQKLALELNGDAAELQRLESDVSRTQKQCDLLDSRIKEVNVNSEDSASLNIQVLEVARAGDSPTKPRKASILAAALVLGLMLGATLAVLRDWLDQRLASADEVSELLGLPVLGIIPHMGARSTQGTRAQIVQREPGSAVAEAFRTVRTAIHFSTAEPIRTIMITSPSPGDGKSTTASNLAIVLAQAGHSTVLLDADLRKPTQHTLFALEPGVGLSDILLSHDVQLADALHPTDLPNLSVLPVGVLPPNPAELITGPAFARVLESLLQKFDRVVIDTPPVTSVADARIIGAWADATVLVVRVAKSTRRQSSMAVEGLRSVGANVTGTVVNDVSRNAHGYGYKSGGQYGYYGAYGYTRSSDNSPATARRLNGTVQAASSDSSRIVSDSPSK